MLQKPLTERALLGVRQTGGKHFRMTNYQLIEFILKIMVSSSSKMFTLYKVYSYLFWYVKKLNAFINARTESETLIHFWSSTISSMVLQDSEITFQMWSWFSGAKSNLSFVSPGHWAGAEFGVACSSILSVLSLRRSLKSSPW